jgi:hypothetical protein
MAVVLLCLAGCHPISRYDLTTTAPPSGAVPLEVNLKDERPGWERRFYLAGHDGVRLRNNVTFVPVEKFAPSPWDLLRDELNSRYASVGAQPTRVDLTLRSFRTVVDLNYRNGQVPWYAGRWGLLDNHLKADDSHTPSNSNTYGSTKFDDEDPRDWFEDLGVMLGFVAVKEAVFYSGSYVCEGVRQAGHQLRVLPGRAGPPKQVADLEFAQGVTFETELDAVVTFASGFQSTAKVYQTAHVPSHDGCPTHVTQAIQAGMAGAADKIVRQTLGLAPIEVAPPPSPAGYQQISPAVSLSTSQQNQVQSEIERLQQAEAERYSRMLK